MVTVHIFISGVVQGVGFRQFLKYSAKKNSVVGWVQNTADGRVEAMLQGSKENIEQMIVLCRKGPAVSEVKHVEVLPVSSREVFEGFEVKK